jgi:hypothetical protein
MKLKLETEAHNRLHRSPTSWFFLWFSNDFGVTVIGHQNADAMVLASARLRGIHPLDNIQGRCPGGMPLKCALARNMASAFWWWIMAWQRLLESQNVINKSISIAFCVSAIHHDSSLSKYRKQKQSLPWTCAILNIFRGGLLLFPVLAESIMTNSAYAKKQWRWTSVIVFCGRVDLLWVFILWLRRAYEMC